MSLTSLARRLKPRTRTPQRKVQRRARLWIENLEDRRVLSAYLVTTTADSGTGSLRDAITQINADTSHSLYASPSNPAVDEIDFKIPTSDPGYSSTTGAFTITPLSALPSITTSVVINGYTQPGASPNTLLGPAPLGSGDPIMNPAKYGDNAILKIQLDGANAGNVAGLTLLANNITVQGFVVNRFADYGIVVGYNYANYDTIEGNFLGTDVTGTQALGNGGADIYNAYVSHTTIGGATSAARNIISGAFSNSPSGQASNGNGIALAGNTGQTLVQGNFIGTDITGRNPLGNALAGISIDDGPDLIIGNVISGSNGGADCAGIAMGTGAGPQVIQTNFIGTDVTGTQDVGNENGIWLNTGGHTIGGPGAGNLISGNQTGMVLSAGNLVQSNYIGTDVTGTKSLAPLLPNGMGIVIGGGSSSNTIGGTTAGARNVISGNRDGAITIYGSDNVVQGNYMGTDVTGTIALAGGNVGIANGATNNMIGGATVAARNIIVAGLEMGSASGNLVQGNYFGTDVTGTKDFGGNGVNLSGSTNNTIGGTAPGAGNLIAYTIAGNWGDAGVVLDNGATGNLVQGNIIEHNPGPGIAIIGSPPANKNTIGGMASGAGNTIAFNGGAGVFDSSGTGDAILSNSIYSNGGGGIQLQSGSNANDNQAAPVLELGVSAGGTTVVAGTFHSVASTTFTLQFFANAAADPSGYGEGQTFLGNFSVTTDANGNAKFLAVLSTGVPVGQGYLSATATNQSTNDTSQFAQDLSTVISNTSGLPYVGVNPTLLQELMALLPTLQKNGDLSMSAANLEAVIAQMLGL